MMRPILLVAGVVLSLVAIVTASPILESRSGSQSWYCVPTCGNGKELNVQGQVWEFGVSGCSPSCTVSINDGDGDDYWAITLPSGSTVDKDTTYAVTSFTMTNSDTFSLKNRNARLVVDNIMIKMVVTGASDIRRRRRRDSGGGSSSSSSSSSTGFTGSCVGQGGTCTCDWVAKGCASSKSACSSVYGQACAACSGGNGMCSFMEASSSSSGSGFSPGSGTSSGGIGDLSGLSCDKVNELIKTQYDAATSDQKDKICDEWDALKNTYKSQLHGCDPESPCGLSTGAIVGIVIGCLFGVGLIVAIGAFVIIRKRKTSPGAGFQ